MADSIAAAMVAMDLLASKERRQCIETLIKILKNVHQKPNEAKYRTLKLSNERFCNDVWNHDGGQAVMEAAGWRIAGDTVQLLDGADVSLALEYLLANREVRPDECEWVAETKHVIPNAAKQHEEQLKEKALKEKEKEMQRLKKDKAERQAIAERIRNEHRADMEQRQIENASRARPLGSGGIAKMSDFVSQGGG
ncbi:unnamed protein product [Meganyctiphanes norvegica]|uniref:PUB domain-containing protein n=1 Tax=Meganyctiphanes norvegica TaxID=48144 RepID=A0AAV2QIP8_MEGNR